MTSASDEKWRPFNCFSIQRTSGSPTGPDLENRVGDQDTGSPGRPFSSGLQVSGEPGHCRARTRHPWWPSRGLRFSSKMSVNCTRQAEMSNTPRWYFGPLEDNQYGGCRLDTKKSRRELFQRIFELGILGEMSRYAATPLIVAVSPGPSDRTRFRPWWLITTGNHLDHAEEIPNLLRRLVPLKLLIRVQAFRDPFLGELPHVQIFMNDGSNPLTWDAQVLSHRFSWNLAVVQD